jgi:signal transduction histidine kinase
MTRNIRRSLQEPENPVLATYRARHGDGTWHIVETVLINLADDPDIGGLAVSFRDVTESKRTERAVRRLSSQILRAQEAERGRIALELHDHVGSELAFLEMELAGLARDLRDDVAWRRQVLESLAIVGRIRNDCHQIVVSLGSRVLYELGLVRSLEWYVEDFERRTGISSVIDTPTLDIETDRACALAAYRIVQEALANVCKHSNATEVEVSVRQKKGALCLSVADNGVGFDSARLSKRNHLGLAGMKERAMLAGGNLRISSSPGKGTRIDARLPNSCKGTLNHSSSQGEEDDNDSSG